MHVHVHVHVPCLPADPSAVFRASLSCAGLLLHVRGCVVMEMLQCGRTLMAVATLMYAPAPLEEVKRTYNT